MTRSRTGVVELSGGLGVESRIKQLKTQNTNQRFEVLMLKGFIERLVRNGILERGPDEVSVEEAWNGSISPSASWSLISFCVSGYTSQARTRSNSKPPRPLQSSLNIVRFALLLALYWINIHSAVLLIVSCVLSGLRGGRSAIFERMLASISLLHHNAIVACDPPNAEPPDPHKRESTPRRERGSGYSCALRNARGYV
ncbi:hypothetical protein B0H14DRAFT_2564675 [Mycena olivaceomarginata]|nr:hypothetical protein B0H14DRAFT_2564675 [Mycena olivaceomarginata]